MVVPVVADADTLFGATTRGLLIHLDYQGLIRLHWSPLILHEMSSALGACRTWGVEAKFGPSEDSFCRICRPIAVAMGQKAGEKWTAAAKLQPTFPKSDRLLVRTGRKPDQAAATKHEALMRAALPQAEVPTADVQAEYQAVAWAMRSAKDTHVAACAHVLQARHYYPNTAVVSLVTKNIRDFGVKKLATLGIDVQRPDGFLRKLITENETGVASAFAALRATLRSAPTAERLLDRLAADGQIETAAALLALRQAGTAAL